MTIVDEIPTKYGKVCVIGPYEHVVRWNKSIPPLKYEQFLTEELRKLEFDTFIDVGAAFGYFSHVFSHEGKKCIAYEADPFRFACLKNTTLVDTELNNLVVGNCKLRKPPAGYMATNINKNREEFINVKNIKWYKVIERTKESKSVIKSDIEGGEFDLLKDKKALTLIKDDKEIVWAIEVHESEGKKKEDLLDIFQHRNIREVHAGPRGHNFTYLIT